MAYRLKPNRLLARELRRIVDTQLAAAIDGLDATGSLRRDAAVHKGRRHIKKIRAAILLVREPLGERFAPFNERMREAHRQLGPIADGESAVATIKRLRTKISGKINDHVLASLQTALLHRVHRVDWKAQADRVLPSVVEILRTERARVSAWAPNGHGVAAIAPGLHRSVRRARKAMRRAVRHPTAEHYHAWRCRVKELWYHMRLLNRCCGNKLAGDTHRLDVLDECLGEHHNVMLVEQILVKEALLPREAAARCLRLLRRYQHQLRRRARTLGPRALHERPHQVIDRVESLWRSASERRAKERRHTCQRAA